jgi:predicted phage tail component-like protein
VYTLIAQNKYGQELELTHNEAYVIESIEGLDPPDAVINTTRNANADGSVFNSSYVDNRQITITLAINGPAEVNRINLYRYFKAKHPVTLYYKNDTRDVYITGFVQNIQIELFNKKQIAQIIILCPEPFFNAVENTITDFSSIESLFEFPFSIEDSANLLPNTMTTQTIDGITFTVNDDGTVKASGTSTDYTWSAYVNEEGVTLPAGLYRLTGCVQGGSSTTYRLQAFSGDPSSPTQTFNDYGYGKDIRLTEETTLKVRILIKGSIDNTFKPMISVEEHEDQTASVAYQEYDNPPGEIEFSEIILLQEKNLINNGDVETGALFVLRARGSVTNPVIFNVDNNQRMKFNLTLSAGDEIHINTKTKQKAAQLISDGVTTSIVGNIAGGSTWFQILPGDNVFTVSADISPENLDCYAVIVDQYEGV